MRRIRVWNVIPAALVLLVAACAPVAVPVREGETVTVTITAREPLHYATLSLLNAATEDPRCVELNEGRDAHCTLGTLLEGEQTVVVATGPPPIHCRLFWHTNETPGLSTFRTAACS